MDGVPDSLGYFSPKPTIRSNFYVENHTRATDNRRELPVKRPEAARRPGGARVWKRF